MTVRRGQYRATVAWIVIAEGSVLFREGLVRLLNEAGHEVAGAVGDAESLMRAVADGIPDVVIVDVRMPPDMTDDGVRAAHALRSLRPNLPILLLLSPSRRGMPSSSSALVHSGTC